MHAQVLLAWSNDTIVVAFRGTAGMANIWSDAKVHFPALFSAHQLNKAP